MRYGLLTLVSWAVGVVAYAASLYAFYGERFDGRDAGWVLVWSLLAFVPTAVIVYLPCMFGLRRWLGGHRSPVVFPAVAAAIGIVPTLLTVMMWGGDLRALWSPEAFLFLCLFAVGGAAFGCGFVWCQRA